jgi:nucleoside transporter
MGRRIRLSVMMFLQYAIHAVWFMQLAAYLDGKGLGGTEIGWVGNTTAIGAILAPILVGMIADRFFASERVLAVLNFAGAALLYWASTISGGWEFGGLVIPEAWAIFIVLLLQQACYMPTWAITNSIAMANCEDTERDLPPIRVFGSIGWVSTALFGLVAVRLVGTEWDGTPLPMIAGAIMSALAGLFAFALPHTPPPAKGEKASLVDILGLRALGLLKKPSFAVFILVSMIAMIPFAAYWTFFSLYLKSLDVEVITGTMHLGQFIEIFAMWLLLPIALKKMGIKWTLVAGVAIMALRYVFFMFGGAGPLMTLNYLGVLVHGIVFSFFFISGFIYADQAAPKGLRAQAQSLVLLVTSGIGMLAGNWINGELVEAGLGWKTVWMIPAIISAVLAVLMIAAFHPAKKKPAEAVPESEPAAPQDAPAPTEVPEPTPEDTGEGEGEPGAGEDETA